MHEEAMRISAKEAKALGLTIKRPRKRKKSRKKEAPGNTGQSERGKLFAAACKAHGLPIPVEEYQFCPGRRWRFDYCWGEFDLALEVEGGIWTRGRHVRGAGFLADMRKTPEAEILGWFMIYATPQDVESGAVFETIKRFLAGHS